jgi:DNA-binding response OmpR family regulator
MMPVKKKVLICEDNEVELKCIQMALNQYNVDTFLAPDGRKALKLIDENDFDLVITDIHMPYHNGDEILERVRTSLSPRVPVIIISSDREEEVIKLSLKLGADSFIEKPVDPIQVALQLKKFL